MKTCFSRSGERRWETASFLQGLACCGCGGISETCTPANQWLATCGFITGSCKECVLFFFPDRNAFFFFFTLRLNVLTIFQVFKNRNCCVAMAPCATPEQLSHPFDAGWAHDAVWQGTSPARRLVAPSRGAGTAFIPGRNPWIKGKKKKYQMAFLGRDSKL